MTPLPCHHAEQAFCCSADTWAATWQPGTPAGPCGWGASEAGTKMQDVLEVPAAAA